MIFTINAERMRILCSLPFIFYTHERMQVFVLMKNVYFHNNELHYDTDENHCITPINANAFIRDANHGFRLVLDEGMQILFLNLVPVTPEVCAKLSLLGK